MPRRRRPYDARWREVRAFVLERDWYVCRIQGPGCTGRASEVDHVVPIDAGVPSMTRRTAGRLVRTATGRGAAKSCSRGNRPGSGEGPLWRAFKVGFGPQGWA
jgi:5-methylcytosine-specific restriction endonuclease McrA